MTARWRSLLWRGVVLCLGYLATLRLYEFLSGGGHIDPMTYFTHAVGFLLGLGVCEFVVKPQLRNRDRGRSSTKRY